MKITEQLKQALLNSLWALHHIRIQSALWMMIYLVCGLTVFALCTWQMLTHQVEIKQLLLDYLFPTSWHGLSESIVEFFYEKQAKVVIGNMILGASLVIASVLLFPIKEIYSAKFEKDAKYANGDREEFPLWMQALEESKLLLFYLTAQCLILFIGYYPWPVTQWLSISLSYLFLFFTFGLDFIAPTLQRHHLKYSVFIKAMLIRPWLVTAYGALFSAPAIIIARIMFEIENLTLIEVASYLFLINMFFLTAAIPAGTHLASKLLPEVRDSSPIPHNIMNRGYIVMGVILIISLLLHGALLRSVHHKTQLLKAQYDVDWGSFKLDIPDFSELLNKKSLTNLTFDLEITNPTEFGIVIEKSQIYVDKDGENIAQVDLNGFAIASGEVRRVNIKLDGISDLGKIQNFSILLEEWHISMYIDIWPGIPFIINIF